MYASGRYQEAATEYRRAIELDPSWAAPYFGLGNANRGLGDTAGALAAYEEATSRSPELVEAQIALAEVLIDIGRFGDAEAHLRNAVTTVAGDGRLHAMLGATLAKEGHDREALMEFAQAERLCQTCLLEEERAIYVELKNRDSH